MVGGVGFVVVSCAACWQAWGLACGVGLYAKYKVPDGGGVGFRACLCCGTLLLRGLIGCCFTVLSFFPFFSI